MSAPDTLQRLEGEPEIPPLAPRGSGTSYKPIIAASVLILSIVGVLGFVATRYIGKKEAAPPASVDVASATVTKLRFEDPPPAPSAQASAAAVPAAAPSAQAIPTAEQTRVPSIEADLSAPTAAIPVRASAGGHATKRLVPVGDESPFALGAAVGGSAAGPFASQQGTLPDPPQASGVAGEAQANMKRYQTQLGNMLGQLQGLTDKATGADRASSSSSPLAAGSSMVLPSAGTGALQANPPLFGSMERSATPTVAAGLLGNRSLTMPKGVLFTCSLTTRVISAASGFVGCQVQRNVFSDDGKVVLAERGSHLDGEYRVVQVRPGVTRIPVLWTRLRTPYGVTVDLDSPGTGALGESGIGGYVDNRWPERIGAALLVSLIDDAVKIAATDSNSQAGNTTVLLPSTTAAGSKLAEKVLESTINIPPLLYQNQGSVVGVYVARDVDFSKVYALEPR